MFSSDDLNFGLAFSGLVSAERMASDGARCIAMNGALLKLNGFSRMEFFPTVPVMQTSSKCQL